MSECNIFEIWEDYKSSLLGYIKKRVSNEDDAKDILQDVLLKSYQSCSKGKTVLHLKAWLYKITQNAIVDYYKKMKDGYLSIDFDIKDEEFGNHSVGEASEYIKVLLQLLPDEYSIPLYMYDLEGVDQKTIAAQLNLTLPNTKSRIQRARVKLKERFLECCEVSFGKNGEMISFDIKPTCALLQEEKNKQNKS